MTLMKNLHVHAIGCKLRLSVTTVLLFVGSVVAQQGVMLTAADGVKVYGSYYPATKRSAPIILLFHQAESSSWEYAPIAPRLVEDGFSCLAIDQRSGDDMWGHANQTVAHLGRSVDYLNALPDLEAALAWARQQDPNRKIIVWGSSYSASLVFLLSAKHSSEISGLLAFSPGEYFADKHMIEQAAAKLKVPVFVTSAQDPEEIKAARTIVEHVADPQTRVQYVPKAGGVHGSSTLRSDRNPKGADDNWRAVLAFLQRLR